MDHTTPPRSSAAGQRPRAPGASEQATPVNALSGAVNPQRQYPRHVHFLMRDLYDRGLVPEDWQIVAAEELSLTEEGMTVEFTLMQRKQHLVNRIAIEVAAGALVKILR